MRNLVVCADGTWNTPDQEDDGVPAPTNVVKLYNCVAETDAEGNPQLKYYHPGVGSEGNWWDRLSGGSVGAGLARNIMSAYHWLASNYQEGDRLFLYGFSRGAYTVRSLGGMISRCGLLDLQDLDPAESWKRVEQAFEDKYRQRQNKTKDWAGDWPFHRGGAADGHVQVYFIGVWDTVGALGIPDDFAILNLFDDRDDHVFHDVDLGKKILNARHAVAVDEIRASFKPTLWEKVSSATDMKQVWFAGVHADIGGGYAQAGLSNIALQWMVDESTAKGLAVRDNMVAQIKPDVLDVMHNSYRGIFGIMPSSPRQLPKLLKSNAEVHDSVLERLQNPPITQAPYRSHIKLRPGQSVSIDIFAAQPWNATHVYLEAGETYVMEAEGEWMDASIPAGPGGTSDGKFHPGEVVHLAGSLLGKAEKLFKKISGNTRANFTATKREEDFHWFALVGVIADGGKVVKSTGHLKLHSSFEIGENLTRKVTRSGYLFCFANDAWNFYGNNRGSVRLTVTRKQ